MLQVQYFLLKERLKAERKVSHLCLERYKKQRTEQNLPGEGIFGHNGSIMLGFIVVTGTSTYFAFLIVGRN